MRKIFLLTLLACCMLLGAVAQAAQITDVKWGVNKADVLRIVVDVTDTAGYAVDMEGNIIWRIQNKERVCPEYKFISPYVMINYIDGELIVNDFNGFRFVFSPDDGTFVKRIQSLRPW